MPGGTDDTLTYQCATCDGKGYRRRFFIKRSCATCGGQGKLIYSLSAIRRVPVSSSRAVPPRPVTRVVKQEEPARNDDSGSSLLTGMIIGQAMSGSHQHAPEPEKFSGGGGDFGGGGASGSWESSSSDSGSSSSGDSGSSGGGDFGGGGDSGGGGFGGC